jgi:hypothetical protein
MFHYDIFKIAQLLEGAIKQPTSIKTPSVNRKVAAMRRFRKPKEEQPIGVMHPQEVFGQHQNPLTGGTKEVIEPIKGKGTRHRDMSKLIPVVIMEKVVRNGKVFFRRRTIYKSIEELPAHDKRVEIRLPKKQYESKLWIKFAMKNYASRVGFTEKDDKYDVWRDPQFKLYYIIYKQHTEPPQEKTVLVYNNKLTEKVLLMVKMAQEGEEK